MTTQTVAQESTTGTDDKPLAKKETYQYQPLVKVGGAAGLKGLADVMKGRIAAVLPKHVTPERMLKALMVAASKTPAIFDCTQESICKSLMDASSLGLDCSGTLGSGYLIPFNKNTKDASGKWHSRKECQFIPGYRGLIDLARRGGQISSIEAHAVYAQDRFVLRYGTDSKLIHEPYMGDDRQEEYVCFYAIATLQGGTKQLEVMTLSDIIRIRDAAMAKNRQKTPVGPWADHFGEMARKTVVRRLCKYLPLSPELEHAFEIEDEAAREVIDLRPIENTNGEKRSFGFNASAEPAATPVEQDAATKAEADKQVKALQDAAKVNQPAATPEEAPKDLSHIPDPLA